MYKKVCITELLRSLNFRAYSLFYFVLLKRLYSRQQRSNHAYLFSEQLLYNFFEGIHFGLEIYSTPNIAFYDPINIQQANYNR